MKTFGKKKCEVLKSIRKMVADANGIKYEPAECHHEGECRGTCPRCEQEVKDLEAELRKKSAVVNNAAAVFVGSVAAIGSIGLSSCNTPPFQYAGEVRRDVDSLSYSENDSLFELEGDVCMSLEPDSLCADSAEKAAEGKEIGEK